MNKKGMSKTIFGIMLGITIIILIVALSPVVRDFTESARNESDGDLDTVGMNCSSTDSDFVKAGCISADLTIFFFVGAIIVIAIAIITAKIYL